MRCVRWRTASPPVCAGAMPGPLRLHGSGRSAALWRPHGSAVQVQWTPLTHSPTRRSRGRELAGDKAAAELGVRLSLPLALCLLPAFVLIGVVPLLIAVGGAVVGDVSSGAP